MNIDYKQVQKIKDQYLSGTRVELVSMSGESDMPCGLQGSVDFVDDIGQIHMIWDNNSTLALIPDEDIFRVIPQQEEGMSMTMGG